MMVKIDCRKLCMVSALTLFSTSALASTSSDLSNAISQIIDIGIHIDSSSAKLEYFQLWLRYLFGSFIFQPWTNDSGDISALSYAVGYTNLIALLFGTIMMGYLFGGGALNSAMSGEVLGKAWSTSWMTLRTSLGVGFIMPVSGIGGGVFSFAQLAMIWLILLGSNSASVLWKSSVALMQNYGVYGSVNKGAGVADFVSLLDMMSCVDQTVKYNRRNGVLSLTNGESLAKPIIATVQYKTKSSYSTDTAYSGNGSYKVYSYNLQTKQITGTAAKSTARTYSYALTSISELTSAIKNSSYYITSIDFGSCGKISDFGTLNNGILTATKNIASNFSSGDETKVSTVATDNASSTYSIDKEYQKNALGTAITSAFSIVSDLGALASGEPQRAYKLVTSNNSDTDKDTVASDLSKDFSTFKEAAEAYQTQISVTLPVKYYSLIGSKTNDISKFTFGGWAGAGVWFLKLGQSEAMVSHANYRPTFTNPSVNDFCPTVKKEDKSNACKQVNEQYHAVRLFINEFVKSIHSSSHVIEMDSDSDDLVNSNSDGQLRNNPAAFACTSGDDCDIKTSDVKSLATGTAQFVLNLMGGTMTTNNENASQSATGGFFSANGLQNPFLTMRNVGDKMVTICEVFIGVIVVLKIVAGLAGSGVVGFFGGGAGAGGIQALISYILTPFVALYATAGISLAFVIPFMPVITWINMMIGYLITVVEAVTAAPLAVIQLLTPEGQGILGTRLERAMQLLIVVLIKPTLMIVGLLAAITIGSIAFTIFNQFFWQTASVDLSGGFIQIFALIIIYVSGAVKLIQLVVSIMYTLPNQILEWFSSGVGNRSFGEANVGDMLQGASSSLKSGAGSVMGHYSKGFKMPEKDGNKKKNPSTPGSNNGNPPAPTSTAEA